jgi:hypothetical protein
MSTPDPMKSFRGVVVATLVLEAIVVLLALPVVANLGAGLDTWQGVVVGALALLLFLACGVAGRPWVVVAALCLHVAMIAAWFAFSTIGILGAIFGLVWGCLWWLRHDVARRMAQGRLPSQQQSTSD